VRRPFVSVLDACLFRHEASLALCQGIFNLS
jgi:hypothetical protein